MWLLNRGRSSAAPMPYKHANKTQPRKNAWKRNELPRKNAKVRKESFGMGLYRLAGGQARPLNDDVA